MGLLDFIFGKSNPTSRWTADARLKLVVDLDRHSLCGVPIGQPINRLSRLGPADARRSNEFAFDYRDRGFYVTNDEGRLESICIRIDPDAAARSYTGGWVWRGQEVDIRAETS